MTAHRLTHPTCSLRWALLCALFALGAAPACVTEESVATLEGLLEITPQDVVFNPLYAGVPQSYRLLMTNNGNGRLDFGLTIEDVEGPATYNVQPARVTLAPGEQVTVTVSASVTDETVASGVGFLRLRGDGQERSVFIVASIRPKPTCDDGNPCTIDAFDSETLSCTHENELDFVACDDGNACTERTMCRAGQCVGDAISCVDDVACTVDSCDPRVGCVFEPAPSRCDDDDPCTDDICRPSIGCENPPLEEGAMCASNGCETFGVCQQGICHEYAVPDGVACDDQDRCTVGETCQAGVCTAGEDVVDVSSDPIPVGASLLRIDHCDGDGASGNCSQTVMAEAEKILAVVDAPGVTFVVWQTGMRDPFGQVCNPAIPLNGSYSELTDDGVTDRPGGEDCAATVALTRVEAIGDTHDVDAESTASRYTHSTVILATVRGPAAAAFTQFVPPANSFTAASLQVALASANSRTGRLLVDTYAVGGLLYSRSIVGYSSHHTMPYKANGELVVGINGGEILVIAGTADARSCPNCGIFPGGDQAFPADNTIQEMRYWTFPILEDQMQPGGSGNIPPFEDDTEPEPNPPGDGPAVMPPVNEGTPLFVRSSPSGACFTPQGQPWTNPSLLMFNGYATFSFTAPTDSCGGEMRSFSIGLQTNGNTDHVFAPLPEEEVGRVIHGLSTVIGANGEERQVMVVEQIDGECGDEEIVCDALCEPDDVNCCGQPLPANCLFVEELSMTDDGPPRIWPLAGPAVPNAFAVTIDDEPWVVAARPADARLLELSGEVRHISTFTDDGRTWLSRSDLMVARVSGQTLVGVLPASDAFDPIEEEPVLGGEEEPVVGDELPDVDGDRRDSERRPPEDGLDGDQAPVPIDPDPEPEPVVVPPNVGVQFLGCAP